MLTLIIIYRIKIYNLTKKVWPELILADEKRALNLARIYFGSWRKESNLARINFSGLEKDLDLAERNFGGFVKTGNKFNLSKKIAKNIGLLYRAKPYLDETSLKTIYFSYIH